jgi:hypothetical protein
MKKQLTAIVTLMFFSIQSFSLNPGWVAISSERPAQKDLRVVSSSLEHTVLKFSLSGFYLDEVQTSKGKQVVVSVQDGAPLLIQGAPDVQKLAAALIIPDKMQMGSLVISSQYKEYSNIELAPSKGSFSRKINPATVAYTYGDSYGKDEFFPGKLTDLNDPYIMRDYRGQTLNFYPLQYNPVSKTLRVYYEIQVQVKSIGEGGKNQLERSRGEAIHIDREFNQLYSKRFLNYAALNAEAATLTPQYTPVSEEGSMLILYPKAFLATMQPFVQWKKLKGIRTEIVDVATVGTTSSAIQTYIANYYKNNKNLKYVLLVGDDTEIPPSTSGSDPSDNKYGCLAGNDSYAEVFVGRFSGSTVANIETQATRTIKYEKEMKGTETYLNKGVAVASGDEKDDVSCIDIIIKQMKGSTYTTVDKITSGAGTQLVDKINQGGVGFVPHSGHGLKTSLGSISFSTSSCSKLTNTNAWPYMFCLACDVGTFTKGTCLAEAMVRATYNNMPSGFVATQMAAISQPWYEPYAALKEQTAILTEQYQNNSKWTFGGIAMNGCAKMLDDFPNTGPNVSDTWVIFGDPSLLVFTANPTAMTVSHANTIKFGATSFDVSCNMKEALISLTAGGEIIGTAYSTGGVTTVAINPGLSTNLSTIQITVTAKNKIAYLGSANVLSTVSVDEQNEKEGISMYPNPVSKSLSINLDNKQYKEVNILIYDITGKMILNLNPPVIKNIIDVDLSSLANGPYYVRIKADDAYKTNKITIFK